jgi:CHAT domain-containing protein
VNNEQPDQSYIAFYPEPEDPSGFLLYAQEIYNLRLDSTRLVILSACETGTGQLLKGEGLMSLSRAFSYAGCPNVITSLWKANDESTAIIISKLRYYLSRGFAPDMALQKAKTDLLHNRTIDPRFKQPAYWAHLVSIGNYEPIRHGLQWRWVAISTILMMLIYYFTKKRIKKRGKKSLLN